MSIIDKLKQQLSNSPVEKVSSRPNIPTKEDELKEKLKDRLPNNFELQETTTTNNRPDILTKEDELKEKLKDKLPNNFELQETTSTNNRPNILTKEDELKEKLKDRLPNNFELQETTTTNNRPDISTKEDELKEQLNSRDKIDGIELHDLNDHVKPQGFKEDYILLDTFSVRFEKENHLINPDQIFKIIKPEFDIINSQEQNEIKVTFTVVNSKHFFGKPTELTNFKTDQEIIDLAEDFNQNTPEWIEFTEYGDNSDLPRITTRYWGLKITKINFSDFNTQVEGMIKYYTATITYDRKSTTKGEFNDPID